MNVHKGASLKQRRVLIAAVHTRSQHPEEIYFSRLWQHGLMHDPRLMCTMENTGPRSEPAPMFPSPF